MTVTAQISIVILSSFSLFLLCVLLSFLWRDYRVDAFRQEMFAIRDEMFDYAAAGNLPFDHPAYSALRASLNSLIRFAHKATLVRALLSAVLDHLSKHQSASNSLKIYYAPLRSMPEGEVKAKLMEFHNRAITALTKFLVSGSIVLFVLLSAYAALKLLSGAAYKLGSLVLAFSKYVPGLDDLEAQALQSDAVSVSRLVPAYQV